MPKMDRANRSDFRPHGENRKVAQVRMPGYAGLLLAYIDLPHGPFRGGIRLRDRTGEYYLDAIVHDEKQAIACLDAWMSNPGQNALAFAGANVRANRPLDVSSPTPSRR